jgi:hypothetical protein
MEIDSGLHPAGVNSVMKQLRHNTRHFSLYSKQLKLFIVHTKRCTVGVELQIHLIFTAVLDGCDMSALYAGGFTLREICLPFAMYLSGQVEFTVVILYLTQVNWRGLPYFIQKKWCHG